MKIHLIAAARPNFMKIAPLYHALKKEHWAEPVIVHTGQHYDLNMSDVFFKDLRLPEPDIHLGIGSGTHAEQTGKVMIAYEKILLKTRPDLVIVVGDVNSTAACTLAATKIDYKSIKSDKPDGRELSAMGYGLNGRRPFVGHLEAGLRSFDRTMPEEINRLVTDALADILWTPSQDGDANLLREGVAQSKILRVGNIMIDSLEMLRDKIQADDALARLDLKKGQYGLVTLHRPSNVDDRETLATLCQALSNISKKIPLIFPIHPRTLKNAEKFQLLDILKTSANLKMTEPLNYISFMNLVFNCRFALTDSGGIQEETTYIGTPCITLRPNTERPITVTSGTNRLCRIDELEKQVDNVLANNRTSPTKIEFWDGQTASRVIASIKKIL